MGPESAGIEVIVRKLLGENRKKVVFDLSGVNYIDSTGLGILTLCSAMMQAGSGALRVAGAQPLPQKLFQLTKLDKILSFFPTVEDACRDFIGGVRRHAACGSREPFERRIRKMWSRRGFSCPRVESLMGAGSPDGQAPEYAVSMRQVPPAILLKADSNSPGKRAEAGSSEWARQVPE